MQTTIIIKQTIAKGWNILIEKRSSRKDRKPEAALVASFANLPATGAVLAAAYRQMLTIYMPDFVEFQCHDQSEPTAIFLMNELSLEA